MHDAPCMMITRRNERECEASRGVMPDTAGARRAGGGVRTNAGRMSPSDMVGAGRVGCDVR